MYRTPTAGSRHDATPSTMTSFGAPSPIYESSTLPSTGRMATGTPSQSHSRASAPRGASHAPAQQQHSVYGQQEGAANSLSNCIVPFNLGVLPNMSPDSSEAADGRQKQHHSGVSLDLNQERLVQLQLDVTDYVTGLDDILRNLHEHNNGRLVRRLKEASGVPLSFLYFRTQQEMLRLSGDLTVSRERAALNTLTSLMEH